MIRTLTCGWSDAEMPLARYFFFVGGVLLALLFFANDVLPQSPAVERAEAGLDRTVLRIHSDQKWPERVVFDTSIPIVVPAAAARVEASVAAPTIVADVSTKIRVRDAFAQLPYNQKQAQLSEPKRPEPKPQHKRRVAKARIAAPMVLVAQQPRYGFFASSTW
jgi:hypothetical protein